MDKYKKILKKFCHQTKFSTVSKKYQKFKHNGFEVTIKYISKKLQIGYLHSLLKTLKYKHYETKIRACPKNKMNNLQTRHRYYTDQNIVSGSIIVQKQVDEG